MPGLFEDRYSATQQGVGHGKRQDLADDPGAHGQENNEGAAQNFGQHEVRSNHRLNPVSEPGFLRFGVQAVGKFQWYATGVPVVRFNVSTAWKVEKRHVHNPCG
jgi:hypothetical protein